MRKKVGILKRMSCLLLIFLLSINSFAAIVSDNDGSAFITKAEFDALKSSFQAQIDSYNQSIDSKIDGAIASYLAGIRLSTEEDVPLVYNSQSPTGKVGSVFKWYKSISTVQDKYSKLNWQWVGMDEDVYASGLDNRDSAGDWKGYPTMRYMKFKLRIKSKKYEYDNNAGSTTPNFISQYGKIDYTCVGNQVMTCGIMPNWTPFLAPQATWSRYSDAMSGTAVISRGLYGFSRYANDSGDTTPTEIARTWTTDTPNLGTYAMASPAKKDWESYAITDHIVKNWEPSDTYPIAVLDKDDTEYCQTINTAQATFYYKIDSIPAAGNVYNISGAHVIDINKATWGGNKLEPFGTYWCTNYYWAVGPMSGFKTQVEGIWSGNDIEVDMRDDYLWGGWTTALVKPIISGFFGLRVRDNLQSAKYSQIPILWNYNRGLSLGTSAGVAITDKLEKDGNIKVSGTASENGYMWIYCSKTGDYNWEITNRSNYTTKFKRVIKDTAFTFDNVECEKDGFCFVVFIPDNNNGATITFNSATLTIDN